MKTIKIANKEIGEGKPVFIIAEAGVNHNGKLDLAKRLIDVAKEAGVDAVKFQTFKTELNVSKTTKMASYQEKNTGKKQTMYEMLKKLELTEENFKELKKYCDNKGMIFLSTPHSNEWSVNVLEKLNVLAYKIASGDIVNFPFLKYVAEKQKPIILSTGMSYLEEVTEAINVIKTAGNDKIITLQCTTEYPCPIEHANLKIIKTLKEKCGTLVGYSDHTTSTVVPATAAVFGASLIEKHFTLDRGMEGPDHKASLEPKELYEMVQNIRTIEKALGSSIKVPTKNEIEIAKVVRKSIVAYTNIKAGQIINKDMLIIKRPGTGLHSKYLNDVMGKKAKQDIKKDETIDYKKLS